MVMSGLSLNPFVDHIRLMIHFMMAMILVSYTYIQYLNKIHLNPKKLLMSYKNTLLFFVINDNPNNFWNIYSWLKSWIHF